MLITSRHASPEALMCQERKCGRDRSAALDERSGTGENCAGAAGKMGEVEGPAQKDQMSLHPSVCSFGFAENGLVSGAHKLREFRARSSFLTGPIA